MMPTRFLVRYPQFKSAGSPLIQASLTEAALFVEPAIYGAKTDYAIGLFAAQQLARSPWGQTQRLSDDESKTIYDDAIDELKKTIGVRMVVV